MRVKEAGRRLYTENSDLICSYVFSITGLVSNSLTFNFFSFSCLVSNFLLFCSMVLENKLSIYIYILDDYLKTSYFMG